MSRPLLEVADLVRSAGAAFIGRNRNWIRWTHIKVLLAIARCRTAALGGHIDECTRCGHRATISYNSCRNRHCPKCQTGARQHWIEARRSELLPAPYVHVVFTLPPQLAALAVLAQPKIFAAWLRPLFRKDWIVYSKPPFGGPEYVLQYLGRYTHRVAISNHRLISFADGKVTFRWRDSAHHNEQKLLTLSLDEFLRRFLLHLLPKRFVRIRNFGFLANRRRATSLPLCFQLLPSRSAPQTGQDSSTTDGAKDLWRCPPCAGPMVIIERLTPAEIQLRSPPLPV